MFRLLALCSALLAPLPAFSLCEGEGFESYLSPEVLSGLDARAAAVPYGTGISWRATRGDDTLTILGTMHLPDPRHATLLADALPDLEAADLLLVEATLDDQTAMQIHLAENPELMVITDGPTLPELLDPALWDQISAAASERGLPGFMAAKMKPWFLMLTLSIPACATLEMQSGLLGLDAMLMTAAEEVGVPMQALEPWQDMFALLTAGTFDEQVDALRLGLMEPALADAVMISLIDSYFDGRTAYGWELADATFDFLPDIDRATFDAQMATLEADMLDARNADWIPVIEDAATTHDDIFVAFGAAHLFGERGVLNLLAENGWTVTPL